MPGVPWQEAIEADPRNPLAKFEKASVLLAEERYRDALVELHALKVRSLSSWDSCSSQADSGQGNRT